MKQPLNGLFLFRLYFQINVFHAGRGTACFAFVLHLVQLAFEFGDQFVDGSIHIFVFGAGDQWTVGCTDGRIGNEPLWFFR